MAMKFASEGPSDTFDKLMSHKWGEYLERLQVSGEDSQLQVGEPYRVRYPALPDIANGKVADPDHPQRWRHLIHNAKGQPLAEVELDEEDNPSAIHHGPGKDGLVAALAAAEDLDGDFEASVIMSAGLKFCALHLDDGQNPQLIPFAPNLTSLPNYKAISADEAAQALAPLAQEVMKAMEEDEAIGR